MTTRLNHKHNTTPYLFNNNTALLKFAIKYLGGDC